MSPYAAAYANGLSNGSSMVRSRSSITYSIVFPHEIKEMAASNSVKHLKHLRQQASLLEQLSVRQLLSDDFCYVELGAGKGGLSEKIGERFKKSNFILIDRATVRQKKENQFTNSGRGGFERVKGDIANFDLKMVEDEKPKVCIAKHLCGEATDLAIRGSLRAKELQGIVIARFETSKLKILKISKLEKMKF